MKFSVLPHRKADTELIFAQAIAKNLTKQTFIFDNERFFLAQVNVWR